MNSTLDIRLPITMAEELQPLFDEISEPGEVWTQHPLYSKFCGSSHGRMAALNSNGTPIRIYTAKGRKIELTSGSTYTTYHRKQYLPHRFIWECFYGVVAKDDTRLIHFKDGDRTNRNIDNLEMVMPAQRRRLLEAQKA